MTIGNWAFLGVTGQAVFFSRFLVQWIASEREKRSIVPRAFWWLSVAGGVVLFTYAAFGIHDPVFTIGQGLGLVVYARNLALLRSTCAGGRAPVAG